MIGAKPYAKAGGAKHPGRLFVAVVGRTAASRKGTSRKTVWPVFAYTDPAWATDCRRGGFGSGESIIETLADPRPTEENPDPKPVDRRLMILEGELSGPLTVAARRDSTLSMVLRDAWDGEPLYNIVKGRRLIASNTHISVLGDITPEELSKKITSTDIANGFANRFMYVIARRDRLDSEGGADLPAALVNGLMEKMVEVSARIDQLGLRELRRTEEAKELWRKTYEGWAHEELEGVAGAILGRREAHALRLQVLYAAMDASPVIEKVHVEAALSAWEYAQASALYIFEKLLNLEDTETLYNAIRDTAEKGLDLTGQNRVFKGNRGAWELASMRSLLANRGLIRTVQIPGTKRQISFAL